METHYDALTPYENFMYELKAKETRRQYPNRLDKFLTFVGLEGIIPQKCNKLCELRNRTEEFESHIIRFMIAQKER
jgi:hypothetical protein